MWSFGLYYLPEKQQKKIQIKSGVYLFAVRDQKNVKLLDHRHEHSCTRDQHIRNIRNGNVQKTTVQKTAV